MARVAMYNLLSHSHSVCSKPGTLSVLLRRIVSLILPRSMASPLHLFLVTPKK